MRKVFASPERVHDRVLHGEGDPPGLPDEAAGDGLHARVALVEPQ